MSLYVKRITNGERTCWYVMDSLKSPTQVQLFDRKEDIPESIRDYAKDEEPKFWGPDMARIMGCQKLLYPNFTQVCALDGYNGKPCVAESCKYVQSNYMTCKYANKKNG